MADKKYKCENGHEFSLSEFDDRKCADCDSELLSPLSNNPFEKVIDFFKNNKIIGLGIGVLLLLILILNLFDSNDKPVSTYKVDIQYDTDIKGFVFGIKKTTIIDGVPKHDFVDFTDNESDFNFTVSANGGELESISPKFKGIGKNIYYPCKEGDYSFTWIYSSSHPHKDKKKESISLSAKFGEDHLPSSDADCAKKNIKITNASIDGCDLVISTNFDTIKTKIVMISIHGKSGPYEKRNRWNVENEKLTKFVIYYAIEAGSSDTASFGEKDNQNISVNCKVLPQVNLAQIRAAFIASAVAYGNAPDSRSLQSAFNNLLKASHNIKIKLNGKFLNGESELYNILYTDYNNNGRKYKLVPASLVISNMGTIESFEFITN